jgi:hypothetical protein
MANEQELKGFAPRVTGSTKGVSEAVVARARRKLGAKVLTVARSRLPIKCTSPQI